MTIACAGIGVGATKGLVYLRSEYPRALWTLQAALQRAVEAGYLGEDVLGSGRDFQLEVRVGAGAYICGEETSLLNSIEGVRPYPRNKPPFPAVEGLFACPTIVNNVETIANIPHIIRNGADWHAGLGHPEDPGSRLWCVSGHVEKPGVYEIETGFRLQDLIDGPCGGMRGGKKLKAVIPGGGTHGQLFSSPADARAFREYAFNALSVPAPKPPSGRRARVYIMQRGTAGLATLDRIRNFLRTDKEMKAIVDVDWAASATPAYGQLSGVPLADRLKILRQTDILIGPYGADMTAAAFMESRSSVVEIIHPRLVSSGLASAVESAGQIYHLVPGEPVKGNADCDSVNTKCPSGFLAPDKADGKLSSDCVHALHACPLSYTNTDLFSAEMLILVQKVTSSKWISVPAKP